MATTFRGRLSWSLTRDKEGHRTYNISHLVDGEINDGPGQALLTAGLPVPGNHWIVGNDADLWAYCQLESKASPVLNEFGEPTTSWVVDHVFSTKPTTGKGSGADSPGSNGSPKGVEDPLSEPMRVRGGLAKHKEEVTKDRYGDYIRNSAHEQLRGPLVEFDVSRDVITVEQNVLNLQLETLVRFRDTLNDRTLWGLPARCVKLSNYSWEKKFHGQAYIYYTRTLEFETNGKASLTNPAVIESGFDRYIVDEGTKCLRGAWDKRASSPTYGQYVLASGINENTSYSNPKNFIRFKDWNGENAKTILNGFGRPYDPGDGSLGTGSGTGADIHQGEIVVEYYNESNFLTLGIPVIL